MTDSDLESTKMNIRVVDLITCHINANLNIFKNYNYKKILKINDFNGREIKIIKATLMTGQQIKHL